MAKLGENTCCLYLAASLYSLHLPSEHWGQGSARSSLGLSSIILKTCACARVPIQQAGMEPNPTTGMPGPVVLVWRSRAPAPIDSCSTQAVCCGCEHFSQMLALPRLLYSAPLSTQVSLSGQNNLGVPFLASPQPCAGRDCPELAPGS